MLNKVMLIGRLGADPEIRYTQSGKPVCNLSLATTEIRNIEGLRETITTWHRVVLFDRRAEVAQEYLTKGSKIYVEGKISINKYQDRDGNDRTSYEIIGRDFQMLDSIGDNQGGGREQGNHQQQGNYQQGGNQQRGNNQGNYQQQTGGGYRQAPPQGQGGFQSQGQPPGQRAPQQQQRPPQQSSDFDELDSDLPF